MYNCVWYNICNKRKQIKGEVFMPVTVSFEKFWDYYRSTTRTVDYSQYRKSFFWAFSKALEDLRFKTIVCPGDWPSTATIKTNLTKICTKVRVIMISNGVPAAAVTNIIDRFKRWFKEYY